MPAAGNSLLPLVVMLLILIGLIRFSIRKRKNNARKKLEKASNEINNLRNKVLVVTSDTIPGKEIVEVFGAVSGTSTMESTTPEEADAAEKEAMLNLMQNAVNMGGNAIIGVKMTNNTHQQQGSAWMVSKTYFTGTAVKVK
jgi:uncharacterized protein YbjQ (UPF0145 family)